MKIMSGEIICHVALYTFKKNHKVKLAKRRLKAKKLNYDEKIPKNLMAPER